MPLSFFENQSNNRLSFFPKPEDTSWSGRLNNLRERVLSGISSVYGKPYVTPEKRERGLGWRALGDVEEMVRGVGQVAPTPINLLQTLVGAPEVKRGVVEWGKRYTPLAKAMITKGPVSYETIEELGGLFNEAPVRTGVDLSVFLGTAAKVPKMIKGAKVTAPPTPEAIKGLFFQARNRVKHPLGKQTIDDIYQNWGERGVLEGTLTERLSDLWKLDVKDAEILTKHRLGKLRYPLPSKMRTIADNIDAVLDETFKIADEVGVKVKIGREAFRPIQQVKNYVPRKMKRNVAQEIWEDIYKVRKEAHEQAKLTGEFRDQIFADIVDSWYRGAKFNPRLSHSISYLLKTKQAKTPGEAVAMMDEVSFNELFRPFVNIERPRALRFPLDFYETDMRQIMASYISGFSKRIPEIRRWGQEGQGITTRLRKMTVEGFPDESRILKDIVASVTGRIEKMKDMPPWFRKFTEGITAYEVGSKIGLGTATVPQFTQPTISFIPLTRTVDWVRGGANIFSNVERSWARQTGAPGFEQIRSITGMRPRGIMGQFAEVATKATAFQGMNKVQLSRSHLIGLLWTHSSRGTL